MNFRIIFWCSCQTPHQHFPPWSRIQECDSRGITEFMYSTQINLHVIRVESQNKKSIV